MFGFFVKMPESCIDNLVASWKRWTRLTFCAANLPTNIIDFRGFDSSIISTIRGGILMSIGDFPESSSQAILVGVMLVGRLGVLTKIQDLGDFTRGSSNV